MCKQTILSSFSAVSVAWKGAPLRATETAGFWAWCPRSTKQGTPDGVLATQSRPIRGSLSEQALEAPHLPGKADALTRRLSAPELSLRGFTSSRSGRGA